MAQDKFLVVEQKLINREIHFKLSDGQRVTFSLDRVNDAMRERAMYHGFNQKIRDAAAGFGKAKDTDGAFEEMMKVVEGLYNGEWNRKGGSGPGVLSMDLAQAIAKAKGVSLEKALAAVEKASEDQVKAWMKVPAFAAEVAQAKARRLAEAAAGAEGEIDIDFGEEG